MNTYPIFSYGDLKYINSTHQYPDPEFSNGQLDILYRYYQDSLTKDYVLSDNNNVFLSNNKLTNVKI